jgi:cell division protein FtsI/penicillin-binding protein 2
MKGRHLEATSLVQDVKTGALLVFASSQPDTLDVSSQVLPLSLSKVFLAASWWDHNEPDQKFESHGSPNAPNPAFRREVNVHEMLVGGSDSAGEQMAIALRKAVGTQGVLADLRRYGFNMDNHPFWVHVDEQWRARLTPKPALASLANLNDQDWAAALSIGESHMETTLLQGSRFLQAVGNNGLQCSPFAIRRAIKKLKREQACIAPERIVEPSTARQLREAMIDTVKRGTADQISGALDGTSWAIGGRQALAAGPEHR